SVRSYLPRPRGTCSIKDPLSLHASRTRNVEIELTEEQRLLRETCREFADRELKPNAKRWDREHKYPAETVKKAFELGLGGVAVPSEWGGAGMDNVAYALAIEEISRGCASVGVTLSVNNSLYC